MRISFCFWQNPSGYSGGRYHAWLMALSFAKCGHEVVVWTTGKPSFAGDFEPSIGNLNVINDPLFKNGPEGHFDWVVICPHQKGGKHWHYAWLRWSLSKQARIMFVDYESPNWFRETSGVNRPLYEWIPWGHIARFASVVVSQTITGSQYAREWYQSRGSAAEFVNAYPPVNEVALKSLPKKVTKEREVIIFGRMFSRNKHKGGVFLIPFLKKIPKGWTVMLIVKKESMPEETLLQIQKIEKESCLVVEFSGLINDKRKFELIASSRVLLFPSLFEGYGYPPVEARCVGTPVVAFDLPILEELHSDSEMVRLVEKGDVDALAKAAIEAVKCQFLIGQSEIKAARKKFSSDNLLTELEPRMLCALQNSATDKRRVPMLIAIWEILFACEARVRSLLKWVIKP